MFNNIQKKYPASKETIYLNNAGSTLISNYVRKALEKFINNYHKYGSKCIYRLWVLIDRVRELLSEILSCKQSEIALTHNTAEGMNLIAQGFPFKRGDNIILLENEYPSNVHPWLNLRKKGVEIRFLKSKGKKFRVMDLEKIVDKKTKLVSFSFVHWIYGFKLDVNSFGEFCSSKKIHFVLDGAQGVGLCPIDVKKAKVDALSMPAWKWLNGPIGMGLFYCSESFIDKLDLVMSGTTSFENFMDFSNYEKKLFPDSRRFQFSTMSILDIVHFYAGLKNLKKIGIENAYKHVLHIIDIYSGALRGQGFTVITPMNCRDYRSGILSFKHKKFRTKELHSLLTENNVTAPIRGDYIRLSPYIYNTDEEVHKIINILPSQVEKCLTSIGRIYY